jgi:hypothetical protein
VHLKGEKRNVREKFLVRSSFYIMEIIPYSDSSRKRFMEG